MPVHFLLDFLLPLSILKNAELRILNEELGEGKKQIPAKERRDMRQIFRDLCAFVDYSTPCTRKFSKNLWRPDLLDGGSTSD